MMMTSFARRLLSRPSRPHDLTLLDSPTFDRVNVQPLVEAVCRHASLSLESCLDVGCGPRPGDRWFARHASGPEPRFGGADIDPVVLQELAERGIDAVDPRTTERDLTSDLVMAKEVIEHLPAAECEDFVDLCARNTKKVFALTTPNFEYWQGLRATDATKECRWVPDHFKDFRPESSNPHTHKQEMTPESVGAYLEKAFPSPTWQRRVYRAWPWTLRDEARGTEWRLYFKIFALAWRA